MKKTGIRKAAAILALMVGMMAAAGSLGYAEGVEGLELTKITPKDGESGKQITNMAIKMAFNEKMATEENVKENSGCFSVQTTDGKTLKFSAVYDEEKYPNDIWLIMEDDLESDTEYVVTISGDLKSVAGHTLGEEMTSSFQTRNTKTDNNISMLLTFGMMGLMFYTTSKVAKKAQEQQAKENGTELELNPYKIAKEKGISVEEAVSYVEKEKAKVEKAAKKKAARAQRAAIAEAEEDDGEEELALNTYRVKKPHSIKEAGAPIPKSVIRRNKEKKEAERLAAERRKANSAGKKKKK